MKKFVALALILVLTVCLMCGCRRQNEDATQNTTAATTSTPTGATNNTTRPTQNTTGTTGSTKPSGTTGSTGSTAGTGNGGIMDDLTEGIDDATRGRMRRPHY